MGSVLSASLRREGVSPARETTPPIIERTEPSSPGGSIYSKDSSPEDGDCGGKDFKRGLSNPEDGRKTSKGGLSPCAAPRDDWFNVSPKNSRSASPVPGDRRKSSATDSMKARVLVKTGEQEKSGTDANVYLQFEDENGLKTTKLKLDLPFYDDLERGKLDSYVLLFPEGFERVVKMYMTRDKKGLLDGWFCDYVIIQDPRFGRTKKHRKIKTPLAPGTVTSLQDEDGPKAEYYFPVHRWVSDTHQYEFLEFGCYLPQFDPCRVLRVEDLEEKRNVYQYCVKIPNGPAQIDKLPSDEKFSDEYFWTFSAEKVKLLTQTTCIQWTTTKWKSFKNFATVFKNFKQSLGEPKCVDVWQEDRWFGLQRVMGTDCLVIELCPTIPDKLDVTNDMVEQFLEGYTLEEALELKKIFKCDLHVLEGLECKDDRIVCAPIALFYLDKGKNLMPIAIQLMQQKGPDNPVFTPADPASTWLVAKMYYNNAEAQHHQGFTHLGRTHILMEGLCVCTHRNLSPSHPLFKLLAPHFLFLLAINSRGLEKLVSLGGWVDICMTQGVKGIFTLIGRSVSSWRMDEDGVPEEEMKKRGVLDSSILPYYPYRDDAIPLFTAIKKYATKVLEHYYDTPDKVLEDHELQQWRREMVTPTNEGGVGIAGVPGDDKGFTDVSQVIEVTASIISNCSLGHAAANFQQYEQYAFVPNYPGILMAPPPTEKKEYSEQDILALLPTKKMTLDIMLICKLLSKRGTNSLGDFEMQYMYDPVGVQAASELRADLERLSLETKLRNLSRDFKYEWLDPACVPNSISV